MQPAPGNPHGDSEDPLNRRVVEVTDAVNAYLAAILSGDQKAMDEASRRWEAAICRKYKVCTRCHDEEKPLETETMCLECVEQMRAYQRKHWHIRVANGTATRGTKKASR